MASLFYEGFDEYGPPRGSLSLNLNGGPADVSSLLTQNRWTSVLNSGFNSGNFFIIPGLSETGYALVMQVGFGPVLSKTLRTSYTRLIGGFRFLSTLQATSGVAFYDGPDAQVSIGVDALTGLITVYAGQWSTVLGRSQFSVSGNTIHYLEYDITFGLGGSGSYQVWIDGVSVVNGIGGTQQSCNASANVFQLASVSAGAGGQSFMAYDDLYLFDSTTATNNQVVLANPRIESQWPIADYQKQFANIGNIIGVAFSEMSLTTGIQDAPGANTLFLRQFSPTVNCNINAVSILPGPSSTNNIVKIKAVIYSDSSGVPGTLLSGGVETVGSLGSIPMTSSLSSPQALTAGTPYWIGVITDTAVSLSLETDQTKKGSKVANAYASGAPSTAPTMTANQASWVLYGRCTGAATNYQSMAVDPPAGDVSSIQSSTVNNEDLYTFPALSSDVTNVYGVMVSGHARLAATGSRTIDLRTLSNATDSGGSITGQTPQTSYGWFDTFLDLDPDGNIGWTRTSLGLAKSGPKVAS